MEGREVTTKDGIQWQCVQAFAGIYEQLATKIEEHQQEGNVEVVCTPSGGAQSVRLTLSKEWSAQLSDAQLAEQIEHHRKKRSIL